MVKIRNQWVMEDYSIVAKLKQDSAGAEDHRNTLATTKHSRWGRCRPRGRRRCNSSSRLRLVELVGWLDAQGYGRAGARFAVMAWALVRQQKLDGAATAVTGKQRKGARANGDGSGYKGWPGSDAEDVSEPARSRGRPRACLEANRRSPAV